MSVDEENLINLVRQYDILYNFDKKDYNNNRKKEEVWDEIGRLMKRSGKNI